MHLILRVLIWQVLSVVTEESVESLHTNELHTTAV